MPDPTPAPDAFQRLVDAVDAIIAKVNRGEPIDALDTGKAHVALRAYQMERPRLLASVRDAALWEAADAVVDNVVRSLDAERAILALIGTAPKEADAMTDDEAFELLAEMAHDIRCPCETCKADRAEMAKEDWSDPDAR